MKKLAENYEKVALAVAVIILLLCAYLGYSMGQKSTTFINSNKGGPPGKSPGDILKENVNSALNTFTDPNVMPEIQDSAVTGRKLYMFQSIARYGRLGVNKPIDPIEKGSTEIHKGIKNSYWFEHGLEVQMKFENAPELDPDNDGFSIAEEHAAGSNPTSVDSYPDLLVKVKVENIEAQKIELKFRELGGNRIYFELKAPGISHELEAMEFGDKGPNNPRYKTELGSFKGRYEYLAKDEAMGPKGFKQARVTIKDTLLNEEYKIFRGAPLKLEDLKVKLYLDALDKGGEEALVLQKGAQFALPFDAGSKKYKVKSLKKKGEEGNLYIVVLEGPDGETREIEALAR